MLGTMRKAKRLEVIFEFLVFGIVVGIVEDVLAVKLTTGEPITLKMIGIIVLLAIPFAIVAEVIADNIDFSKFFERFVGKNSRGKHRIEKHTL